MSSKAELSQRYDRLGDISSVMTAMKSLALLETKKLSRVIEHQHLMLSNIEMAAADFQSFFSLEHYDDTQSAILIAIGSEHGFCGNFNEQIIEVLDNLPTIHNAAVELVVVGSRLSSKLNERSDIIAHIDGSTVTEEVPEVLNRIMDAMNRASGAALFILSHESKGDVSLKQIIPFEVPKEVKFTNPPYLQLTHEEFFLEMLDQYLLAVLYGALYESLNIQSHQRLTHMEEALNRLDETMTKLTLKQNALRQEKIIEEIEVILSSRELFSKW